MKTVLNMIQQEKMHSTSNNIFIPLMFRFFSFKDLLYSLRSNVLIFARNNAKKKSRISPSFCKNSITFRWFEIKIDLLVNKVQFKLINGQKNPRCLHWYIICFYLENVTGTKTNIIQRFKIFRIFSEVNTIHVSTKLKSCWNVCITKHHASWISWSNCCTEKTPLFYNFRGSEISDISVVRSMPNLEVCSVRSVLLYVLKLLVN